MTTGIGASIITLSPNTTARAGDVLSSLNSLNSSGVSNESGSITTSSGQINLANILTQLLTFSLTPVAINGQTSGTAKLFQPIVGDFKVAVVLFNNYQNTGVQALNLSVPFANQFLFICTWINQISFYNLGSILGCNCWNSMSATGSSESAQTLIKGFTMGQCISPCTQIQTGVGGPSTGEVVMIGS